MQELWEVWWLLLEVAIALLEVQEASGDRERWRNFLGLLPASYKSSKMLFFRGCRGFPQNCLQSVAQNQLRQVRLVLPVLV